MATRASQFAQNILPTRTISGAGNVFANDYFIDLTAAQVVLNDVIDLGVLPGYHTISDAILIVDDLDSNGTPTIALDVGIMSGTPGDTVNARTIGNELFAADTTARAGGTARMTKSAGFTIKPTELDRSIGVKIQAAAATAAAGRIRLRVWMHAADHTYQF
jgi:hypothetical protein